MTSADRILDQIDAALGDPFVSPDAMRCGPAPDDEPLRAWIAADAPRVWIAPANTPPTDGATWQPLGWVTHVDADGECVINIATRDDDAPSL